MDPAHIQPDNAFTLWTLPFRHLPRVRVDSGRGILGTGWSARHDITVAGGILGVGINGLSGSRFAAYTISPPRVFARRPNHDAIARDHRERRRANH